MDSAHALHDSSEMVYITHWLAHNTKQLMHPCLSVELQQGLEAIVHRCRAANRPQCRHGPIGQHVVVASDDVLDRVSVSAFRPLPV